MFRFGPDATSIQIHDAPRFRSVSLPGWFGLVGPVSSSQFRFLLDCSPRMSNDVSRDGSISVGVTGECCKRVNRANGARAFVNHAPILSHKRVVAILDRPTGVVLEIGGGCLRNSLHLQSLGFKVHVLEVNDIDQRFPGAYSRFKRRGGVLHHTFPSTVKFDVIVCTFVLEVICSPRERSELLTRARSALKSGGVLILSVRGQSDIVTARVAGTKCSDGYLTPNRTFVRSFNRAQLTHLLRRAGFQKFTFLHKTQTSAPRLLHALAWKDIR